MIIDSSIAGFYLPGPIAPQDQSRPQQPPSQSVNQILDVKPPPRVLDPEAYEKLRRRMEDEERPAVQREGLSSKARRALDSYSQVEQNENRSYAAEVLGLDVFA